MRAHGAPRAAGADQAGGPHEQRQRLLGGDEAGGQQVQVDVEEGHGGGAAHPVQHGLGADQDGRAGTAPPRRRRPRTGHLPHLGAEQRGHSSRSRLTPARSVFMRSRPQAAQTTGRALAAARAAQQLLPAWAHRGRPQRAQRASSPQ